MAIPTIANVTPSAGPSAGAQVAVITGTNFKIPVISYTIPMEPLIPTVSVTIGGRAARAVRVVTATQIQVLTPRYRGAIRDGTGLLEIYPAQDIVITNLDANGVAIPGETVTLVDGFTYERWVIGAPDTDGPILRVLRQLMNDMATDICQNVSVSKHSDYGELGAFTEIDLNDLPAIGLKVDAPRDVEWSSDDNGRVYVPRIGGDGWDEYEGMSTHMLMLDITLSGEGKREAMALVHRVREFVQVNPMLEVDADPDLYPGELDEYPVEIVQDAISIANPNNLNISAFSMGMQVRGIQLLPGEAVQQIRAAATFILGTSNMEAETVSEHTL